MTKLMDAWTEGFKAGQAWEGPNGDGSFGALSAEFIREQAETYAAGHKFSEMADGPTDEEANAAGMWRDGFYKGWDTNPTLDLAGYPKS